MDLKKMMTDKVTLAVILLIVIAVIYVVTIRDDEPAATTEPLADMAAAVPNANSGYSALEKNLEEKLAVNLEKIDGVGKTKVLITLSSDVKKLYARNENTTQKKAKETDKAGGVRETEEITKNSQIVVVGDEALVITEERPEVAGVLIIAQGAANPKVKEQIFEAVKTLLSIEPAKVSVVPMGGS
ncbi:stage III sporulation protein AG [Dehalobacter sp. DCM]|uniref:stage III sporulation protein AG n=1 Tax=Dehalobacter sp. DCM TaxID=2907827 RepID=UPI0030816B85|nr:stage III sporulation protein AG [Dehalobacter sp. DCM]